MIKNLLWKQAMEAAKKKFGDLNTVEANKWLTDKYNALLGESTKKSLDDFTDSIANKIREDLKKPFEGFKPEIVKNKITEIPTKYKKPPASSEKAVPIFSNPVAQEALTHFQSMGNLGEKGIPSFDQIMGMNMNYTDKQIFDVLKQYGWKPRLVKKSEGGMILPKQKPYNFEEKIEFLKKIKGGVGPKTYLQLMSNYLNEGVEKEAITKEERDNFLKRFTGTISEDWTSAIDDENLYMYEGDYERYPPKKFDEGGLAGMLGETQPQQVGLASDREALIQELYDAAGGFDGTGKTFSEFMADVIYEGDYIYAKGGRVGLKGGGMTPSEKWMRNYYYDGKGGYDTWMSFQEFQMGPGVDLWNRHIGKYAEGGIIGLKNGGLSDKYKEYSPKGPWTKGLWDMDVVYSLYETLAPFMQLFMKDGGRVGFKEGKGMTRRTFLKLMGAGAALPVIGKFFKLAKPAAKVMDDIKINLRGDGDWEQDIDGMWSGANWVNYSFEALTDKGRKILAKLSKGKNASLVDQGDGVYFPGKTVKSKAGDYLIDEADHAVDAVDAIKKSKGNISLNTRVGKNTKGIDKSGKKYAGESTDSTEHFKTYSSKNINKQNILDEADDYWVGDYGGYRNKGFYDESVEEIIDIINPTKKAEGGRVGLSKGGGLVKLLETIWNSKFLNKKFLPNPKDLADKTDDAGRELRTRNLLGQDKWSDIPQTLKNALYTAAGGTGIATLLKYIMNKRNTIDNLKEDNVLKDLVEKAEGGRITDYSFDDYMREREMLENMRREDQLRREFEEDMRRKKIREQKQWVAEGGRIGLDAGGPPVSPANLHPLQRPMFYQGGLTKTVPPQRGPMPQGLQSDVYDGIIRPGVINGRN